MRARYVVSLCVLAAAVLVASAVLLAAYGVLRRVAIAVQDASLTRFDLVTTPATALLGYKLSLTLAVRNPNWVMAAHSTEPLEAAYSFHGEQFDRHLQLSGDEGDKLPAGKTRAYRLVTGSGGSNGYVALGDAAVPEYRKQNATGKFEVEVKLSGELTYTGRRTKCKLEATCPLRLKLAPSSPYTSTVFFDKLECTLAKPRKFFC